uniref:Uncharacterized protein n=1 Tax=Heterorhabditis bacteriophora TaxID=37862 RepID=A0A1I7W814_HETBA
MSCRVIKVIFPTRFLLLIQKRNNYIYD